MITGIIIGFSLSVPVGPIGLLCIRRTLTKGRLSGLVSGLGAASADVVYGSVAGFGITVISTFLTEHTIILRIVGGCLLLYVGRLIYYSAPEDRNNNGYEVGLVKDYISTFILTLTNPLTILAFAAIFAAAGVGSGEAHFLETIVLIAGVGLGSALWFTTLSTIVGFVHHMIETRHIRLINKISGAIIGLFGFAVIGSVVVERFI